MPNVVRAPKPILYYRLRYEIDELTQGLVDHVEDSMNEWGIYKPLDESTEWDELYLVEDLAAVYGGISRVMFDVPNHGSVTQTNPDAVAAMYKFPFATASEKGYVVGMNYNGSDLPRLDDARSYAGGVSKAERLIQEFYG